MRRRCDGYLLLLVVVLVLVLLSFACAFTALASVHSVDIGRGKPTCDTAAAVAPPFLGLLAMEELAGFCPGCKGVLVVVCEGARASRAEVLMGWTSPKMSLT